MPSFVTPAIPAGRLSSLTQPKLQVDELLLRPWLSTDVDAVVDAYGDPGIQRWHARSMTEAEALVWIESWAEKWATETGAGWAVELAGEVAGRVDLRTLNLTEALGTAAYWVRPHARGRGIAPKAIGTITDWMFAEIGLHRVELSHSVDNAASCRVAIKAGYHLESTQVSSALHADGWHDMHQHVRINDEHRWSRRPTNAG